MTDAHDIRRLYVFGAGGHGREVTWLAREVMPDATTEYVVDDERFAGRPVNGIPVRLIDDLVVAPDAAFVVAVGDSRLRRRAAAALTAIGLRPIALVHPRTERAPSVRIGVGTVVCAGSILTDAVSIGAHSVVNVGCTISHDVRIGDFVTLSPAVHLAGNVTVEDGAFLGIGAIVINGSAERPLTIGADAVVAAGATVIGDIAPGEVVGGVPARGLRRNRSAS
jgi:sugar O-acyltransferase (sialic acid O-acetyltransferase NeuD family)